MYKWQCFIADRNQGMHHVPVIAVTAEQAAVDAARTIGIPGIWMVVQGDLREVTVREKSIYEVEHA